MVCFIRLLYITHFYKLDEAKIIDESKTVMCIISRGMSFVGLDEIFLAYYCDTELIELPIDYLWRVMVFYVL